jgi:hypothetical protein
MKLTTTIPIFTKSILNNRFRYEDLTEIQQTELARVLQKLDGVGNNKRINKHRNK